MIIVSDRFESVFKHYKTNYNSPFDVDKLYYLVTPLPKEVNQLNILVLNYYLRQNKNKTLIGYYNVINDWINTNQIKLSKPGKQFLLTICLFICGEYAKGEIILKDLHKTFNINLEKESKKKTRQDNKIREALEKIPKIDFEPSKQEKLKTLWQHYIKLNYNAYGLNYSTRFVILILRDTIKIMLKTSKVDYKTIYDLIGQPLNYFNIIDNEQADKFPENTERALNRFKLGERQETIKNILELETEILHITNN